MQLLGCLPLPAHDSPRATSALPSAPRPLPHEHIRPWCVQPVEGRVGLPRSSPSAIALQCPLCMFGTAKIGLLHNPPSLLAGSFGAGGAQGQKVDPNRLLPLRLSGFLGAPAHTARYGHSYLLRPDSRLDTRSFTPFPHPYAGVSTVAAAARTHVRAACAVDFALRA